VKRANGYKHTLDSCEPIAAYRAVPLKPVDSRAKRRVKE